MTENKPIKKPRGKVRLVPGKCIACGARCQSICPVDGIEMSDSGEPMINLPKCIGCVKCVKACPGNALEIFYTAEELAVLAALAEQGNLGDDEVDEGEKQRRELIAGYRGVWVFIEQTAGEAATVSWELLGKGAELAASLGVELCAVILGHEVEQVAAESRRTAHIRLAARQARGACFRCNARDHQVFGEQNAGISTAGLVVRVQGVAGALVHAHSADVGLAEERALDAHHAEIGVRVGTAGASVHIHHAQGAGQDFAQHGPPRDE